VREMLLSVYGTSVVGDDGGRGATIWRDTRACCPGGPCCSSRSGCTHAHVGAATAATATPASAAYSNCSASKQQQLR
jgi:hypothetical protein